MNRGTVHNLAVTHMQDAMSVRGGFGIVRDHDDCLAEILIELTEQAEDGFGTSGIEVAGGFIGEDDFWLAHDGTSESNALLFTAGEFRRFVFQAAA